MQRCLGGLVKHNGWMDLSWLRDYAVNIVDSLTFFAAGTLAAKFVLLWHASRKAVLALLHTVGLGSTTFDIQRRF